jgi:DNA-binding IclR family transcriptional regulator
VLDAVAAHSQPVTLAELVRRTGIPKSTVRRIATDLVAQRMLERCDDGRYRLAVAGPTLLAQGR